MRIYALAGVLAAAFVATACHAGLTTSQDYPPCNVQHFERLKAAHDREADATRAKALAHRFYAEAVACNDTNFSDELRGFLLETHNRESWERSRRHRSWK